jgi:hypothetical protein
MVRETVLGGKPGDAFKLFTDRRHQTLWNEPF